MEFQDGDCGLQLPPGRHQQLVFPAGETTWLNRQNWWVRETWCGSGDFALVLHLYKSCTDEFAFVKPGEDGRAVLEKGGPKNDFFWNLDLPDTDERLREIGEIVGPKDFAEIVLKPQAGLACLHTPCRSTLNKLQANANANARVEANSKF